MYRAAPLVARIPLRPFAFLIKESHLTRWSCVAVALVVTARSREKWNETEKETRFRGLPTLVHSITREEWLANPDAS